MEFMSHHYQDNYSSMNRMKSVNRIFQHAFTNRRLYNIGGIGVCSALVCFVLWRESSVFSEVLTGTRDRVSVKSAIKSSEVSQLPKLSQPLSRAPRAPNTVDSSIHAAKKKMLPHMFNITQAASQEDWSYFKQSSFAWKQEFWDYHRGLKRDLTSWHWVWRIGWVQSCDTLKYMQDKRCQEIMQSAEKDKALVVRSAAVVNYQKVYRGSETSDVVKRLESMFHDQRNFKNGRPLYIAKQIVYAIKEVGGEYSLTVASNLAKSHPQIDNYYQKIGRSL